MKAFPFTGRILISIHYRFWHKSDKKNRQGITEIRYIEGLYIICGMNYGGYILISLLIIALVVVDDLILKLSQEAWRFGGRIIIISSLTVINVTHMD
jgi:hypothetical protein